MTPPPSPLLPLLVLTWGLAAPAAAQAEDAVFVWAAERIGADTEGIVPPLADGDGFGTSLASLGDLDGDGIGDVAVGAPGDDAGGVQRGAVHVLFLAPDGRPRFARRIDATTPALAGEIDDLDAFGSALGSPGDVDGDGIADLAVGVPLDDDGGRGLLVNRGAVWVLFLEWNGEVRGGTKLSATRGGLPGSLAEGSWFGSALASPGDVDGDGTPDLVVGAPGDEGGSGAVWLVLLERDGTVKEARRIAEGRKDPEDGLPVRGEGFGRALAFLGGPDARGFRRLAVGAPGAWAEGRRSGRVWILRLDREGILRARTPIGPRNDLSALPATGDGFGSALACPGDFDGDGADLVVGGPGRDGDDGASDRGAVWLLRLDRHDRVRAQLRIGAGEGGFPGSLGPFDRFGAALAGVGDLDGNGMPDLVVGASGDARTGTRRGAVWGLRFTDCAPAGTVVRRARGMERARLICDGPPRLGSTWSVGIDCSGHEPGKVGLAVSSSPTQVRIRGRGTFLVNVKREKILFRFGAMHRGDTVRFETPIPDEPAFCGTRLYLQAVVLGAPGRELTNALDAQIGR